MSVQESVGNYLFLSVSQQSTVIPLCIQFLCYFLSSSFSCFFQKGVKSQWDLKKTYGEILQLLSIVVFAD